MYTTQPPPIRLFALPTPLAGDALVTIIVQSLITWSITLALVRQHLSTASVAPISLPSRPPPTSPLLRRVFFLDPSAGPRFVVDNAVLALGTAVLGVVLFLPVSVGVLMVLGEREEGGWDWTYEKTWTPEVFKGVLGGAWGVVQGVGYAGFWLVREGWVRAEGVAERGGDGRGGEGGGVVGGEGGRTAGGVGYGTL